MAIEAYNFAAVRMLLEYEGDEKSYSIAERLFERLEARANELNDNVRRFVIQHVVELLDYLSSYCSDINRADYRGRTLLHQATEHALLSEEIVACLLAKGGDVNVRDHGGNTPLHSVSSRSLATLVRVATPAEQMQTSIVRLQQVLDSARLGQNVPPAPTTTAGNVSNRADDHCGAVTQLLLNNNAYVDARNNNGETPLHLCVRNGRVDVLKSLLENGASTDVVNRAGQTPLHIAAKNGSMQMLELLLEHSADLTVVDNTGRWPLHIAAENARADACKLFIDKGANVNSGSRPPLHLALAAIDDSFATRAKVCDTVQVLLDAGADCKDQELATILLASILRLNDFKSTFDARRSGRAPFDAHNCMPADLRQLIDVLVVRGAPLNGATVGGNTYAHLAVVYRDRDLLCTYAAHGGDVDAFTRHENKTPLHLTCMPHSKDMQHLLVKLGAHVDAADQCGTNVFQSLVQEGIAGEILVDVY